MENSLTLGEFVDKYIKPNSLIIINEIESIKDGDGWRKIKVLWRGMSWQCTQNKLNIDYMERRKYENDSEEWRKSFSLCPYSNETDFYIENLRDRYSNFKDFNAIDIILTRKEKQNE